MIYPDCLNRPNAENTFLGVAVAQSWNDLALWEAFLDNHSIASLIELGTWQGGMAMFLSVQGRARGFTVHSIDKPGHEPPCLASLDELKCTFHPIDIFSDDGVRAIADLVTTLPKPLMLFIDNGNKREEWRRFVPFLAPEDYAAVHDWGSEFGDGDRVPRLMPILDSECEQASSLTRFFVVGEGGPA